MHDVVAARVFLTDESLFEAMNDEYRQGLRRRAAGARDGASSELMGSDASVEITLIASTTPKMIAGAAVSPSLPAVGRRTRAGAFMFLSGVIGQTTDPDGRLPRRRRKRCDHASGPHARRGRALVCGRRRMHDLSAPGRLPTIASIDGRLPRRRSAATRPPRRRACATRQSIRTRRAAPHRGEVTRRDGARPPCPRHARSCAR